MIFTIRWVPKSPGTGGEYKVSVPNFDPDGTGVEVVKVADLVSDEVAEHISRRLNPQAWQVIADMRPATREEYAEALRSEARRALATALSTTGRRDA